MIPFRDDNPTEITPYMTVTFIALCVLVFLYEVSLSPQASETFIYMYGAIPSVVFGHAQLPSELVGLSPFSTLISSMFLHGGWMHLISNMLYLWIFGNNIEDVMGHAKFIVFYLLCGVLAALSHAVIDPHSNVPMVGASGAISGILGAYLLLYPHARVLVLIPLGFFTRLMYVPAGVVLGLWILMQVLSGGMSIGHEGGGVAFFAHIGGFGAGMILIGLFKHPHVKFFNPRHYHGNTDLW
ncbi:MAG: rhomboid family intramembrane serine protease [Nitrospirales bacterium]|nr:rhomboid family intramembrane serine protease [Nitrospiraceae bacterium]MDR4488579.1 rhomboid family intramembrane serine protease [Nitrospirales bacterium]HQU28544.1 rhomboid family intramembrane serine protease [Nitrospirales bacterium]